MKRHAALIGFLAMVAIPVGGANAGLLRDAYDTGREIGRDLRALVDPPIHRWMDDYFERRDREMMEQRAKEAEAESREVIRQNKYGAGQP